MGLRTGINTLAPTYGRHNLSKTNELTTGQNIQYSQEHTSTAFSLDRQAKRYSNARESEQSHTLIHVTLPGGVLRPRIVW